MGGDEFAILFSSLQPERDVCSGVARLNERVAAERHALQRVGLSIGILSVAPDQQLSQQQIYRRADAALYEAKKRKPMLGGEINIVHHCIAESG